MPEHDALPVASGSDAVRPAPVVARRVTRLRRIALATVGVVAALVVARYVTSGEQYDPAEAFFASEAATTDHGSTVEPIATPSTTPLVVPATAVRPASTATNPVTPGVRPIAAKQTVAKTPSPPPIKRIKTVVETPAATTVAAPAVDTREPEEARSTVADAEATVIAPSPAAPIASAVDEVTITGCLEIDTDQARFRLADTEGASAPRARSWRTGFFKKRAAPVDLVGSIDALSLHRQVGQRIAATGVLTSRTLSVSSVRAVSPSCN